MTTVEHTSTGKKIIRYCLGKQPLLVISEKLQGVLWLSTIDQVILVQRHWSEPLQRTEHCSCVEHCPTTRVDRLGAVLLQIDHSIFEERILILPEDGWRCLERAWLLKFQDQADIRGLGCNIRRVGSRRNGRTTCDPVQWSKDAVPRSFDLDEAVYRQMHIPPELYRHGANTFEVPPDHRSNGKSSEKPRIALGKPQGR
jgi:hypothetical protein